MAMALGIVSSLVQVLEVRSGCAYALVVFSVALFNDFGESLSELETVTNNPIVR